MNQPSPSPMRRALTLSSVGLMSLLCANCSLPPKEAWNQIRQRGLIPVLIDANQTAVAGNTGVKPSEQDAVRVQPVLTPTVVKTVYAKAVPGRAGYVFTPHTSPPKVVDVKGFQAGEEVRCPFTNQPFLVPDFNAIAAASRPAPVVPVRRPPITEVVSNTPSSPLQVENMTRLEPVNAAEPPVPPVTPPVAAGAEIKQGIPYGTRVPGRPGFVYSPFAARTQLVDVAGTAPGVVVKCPYSNKMFRVPEPVTEEIPPQPALKAPSPAELSPPVKPVQPSAGPARPASPPLQP